MYQTIVEAVLAYGKSMPDKLAVCFKQNRLTYKELSERVRAIAHIFKEEYGVKRGDLIMISALSKPEYVVALLGGQFLGATVVPVDKSALAGTLSKLYHLVDPRLFLTDIRVTDAEVQTTSLKEVYAKTVMLSQNSYQLIEEMEYEIPDMDSTAEIIFTTGTTGNPKGAMLSYRNILVGTKYTRDGINRNKDNIELLPLPLNHSFGLRVLRTLLYVGATVVLQNGFMFSKEMTANIEEFGCTGIAIVPASVEQLYRNLGDKFAEVFSQFKYIEISAGSLSVGMKQRLLEVIPKVCIYNTWGSSETGGVIFLNVSKTPEHIASLGRPAEGVEVAMLDENGNKYIATSIENAGRMIMKGDMQMQGYFNLPDITAETLVNGYLYTGDLAYKTADGYIYMLGRADDIINVGGEKVSPIEVENVASMMSDIRECACVGVEDKEGTRGQIPVLFVVPEKAECNERDISAFLAKKLERYKLPEHYIMIDTIPRNSMKKIDRKTLKKMWESGKDMNRNPVISAIYGRRSVRDFQDKRIPKDILEQIVACGYQAPSGHNMQTWKFVVLTNREKINGLKEIIQPVAKKKGVHFYGFNNPDTIILVSNDIRNPDGVQDSSCAIQNMMLAAYSLGLGSVWLNPLMKICDEPEIRPILSEYGIPQNHNVWGMVALGYPANQPSPLAKKENVVSWIE